MRQDTRKRNSGFSAIEIVISTVVLACALLPVLTLVSSGKKNAAVTEYHVLAQMRARRILEVVAAYPYAKLPLIPVSEDGGLKVPGSITSTAFPDDYENKVKNYKEYLFIEELEKGLSLIRVEVTWTLAGGGGDRKYELSQIVTDESISYKASYPLRQEGTTYIK